MCDVGMVGAIWQFVFNHDAFKFVFFVWSPVLPDYGNIYIYVCVCVSIPSPLSLSLSLALQFALLDLTFARIRSIALSRMTQGYYREINTEPAITVKLHSCD
jgi:hypothetical protein